jgi:alpha-L-rhamnosidase
MADEASRVRVVSLRTEQHHRALGTGEACPRLSWTYEPLSADVVPKAYELELRDLDTGYVRSSGRIEDDSSLLRPWPFEPLRSRQIVAVRVRVWDGSQQVSPWSEACMIETGLLESSDWQAEFVSPRWEERLDADVPPPLLRGGFTVDMPIRRARVYASALGVYELELNGHRVGDSALDPGWTSYHHRLVYRTFDVTSLVRSGENVLGAWLGDGWYRGRLGFGGGTRNIYGRRLALMTQLEVVYSDGSLQVFGTDASWRAARGPIGLASLYDGERYDARAELDGWSSPGYDDGAWFSVEVLDRPSGELVAPTAPPIRCTQEVRPVEVVARDRDRVLLDFGQNLVGRLRIRVEGSAGERVRMRHAEVLEGDRLAVRPLRLAEATDEYVLRGEGVEEWEPRFTFHGFRYAEISGWPGAFDRDAVTARVYHSDMTRTGHFSCSDPVLTQVHDNVVWSMRGNFVGIPTDCPQRDERLGWTGDIQVFTPTASYLYACAGMLGSWLQDLAVEQFPDGTVPLFVPQVPSPKWEPMQPCAVWGDAAVLVPWALYQRFGDVEIVRRQYPSAKAWVECVCAVMDEDGVVVGGRQLGDWLDPLAPPDDPAAARSDAQLVATAYHARSSDVLAQMAGVLGLREDHERYRALAEKVCRGFVDRYVKADGLLVDDAPTSYALALHFGLLTDGDMRGAASQRLAELVEEGGYRIPSGFAGTPVMCDALSENGQLEAAYLLATQRECPSWGYQVTHGATTIWERWDSLLPDGRVNPGQMTSFNHYALGAVADWMHRVVGGLAPAAPGYRRLLVRPRPGGDLRHATTRHDTPFGAAEVDWQVSGSDLDVRVVVPPTCTALMDLPGQESFEVGHGPHRFRASLDDHGDGETSQ